MKSTTTLAFTGDIGFDHYMQKERMIYEIHHNARLYRRYRI